METLARCRERSGWQGNNLTSCSFSIRMDDGLTRYQLATLLSRSYCMVASRVSRMKHVKGMECSIPREVIWGT
jgi:hypothetical protein